MSPIKWLLAIALLACGSLAVSSRVHAAQATDACKQGYVWREAFHGDHVCVKPDVRDQAVVDNRDGPTRRQPGGGPYGQDTCRSGYVWREANPRDHVCVKPEIRDQAATDNRDAHNRVARKQYTF
ncbi:hypothetical protein [Dyella japonica]|uniref:hypothetical protein n=1 Tax=Dyella japonica TaxID=231455 RepID=UPI000A81CA05|nr:hypothetical protein [Dyella japonica]